MGAMIQVRIRRSALPVMCCDLAGSYCKWVTLKGVVVACPPVRRDDGSAGFQVSLLVEPPSFRPGKNENLESKMEWLKPAQPDLQRFSLN